MGNAASFWVRAHTVQRDYTWELRRDEDSLFPPRALHVAVEDKTNHTTKTSVWLDCLPLSPGRQEISKKIEDSEGLRSGKQDGGVKRSSEQNKFKQPGDLKNRWRAEREVRNSSYVSDKFGWSYSFFKSPAADGKLAILLFSCLFLCLFKYLINHWIDLIKLSNRIYRM